MASVFSVHPPRGEASTPTRRNEPGDGTYRYDDGTDQLAAKRCMTDAPRSPGTAVARVIAEPRHSWMRIARLHLAYGWRHRRLLSLADPKSFTELVQHRKLTNRDLRMPGLIDKVAVKAVVADLLGPQWVTPTLWQGHELPEKPPWPRPFVVKSRHGCNQRRFVRTGQEDWGEIRRAAARWVRRDYGGWLDEQGYRGIPRGILVEPFVGETGTLPIDYKFYVFHGQVRCVQVHIEREYRHRWILFDPDWHRLSRRTDDPDPAPPAALDAMIDAAQILGRGFDFVRVDFYETGGTPRFGEMTFYPGSGLDPFDPPALDAMLGRFWRDG